MCARPSGASQPARPLRPPLPLRLQRAPLPPPRFAPLRSPFPRLTFSLWESGFHSLSSELLNAFVCICPSSEVLTENRSRLPRPLPVQVLSMKPSSEGGGGSSRASRRFASGLSRAKRGWGHRPPSAGLPHGEGESSPGPAKGVCCSHRQPVSGALRLRLCAKARRSSCVQLKRGACVCP